MDVRDHCSWSVVLLVIILTTVTAASNPRFRPRTQDAGCSNTPALVEGGDCEYYSCMENSMKCGDTGFLLGFGHRYCTKIDQHRNTFSTEGKKWAEEVKKCVIRETDMALAFGDTTCYSLMEDGLYRIGQCILSSQPSFCKILQDTGNHRVLARILNVADLPGEESEFVVHQLSDSARSCMHSEYSTSLGNINTVRENIRQFIERMTALLPTNTVNAQQVTFRNRNLEAECQTYLDSGDCRFYECFERKFPCAGSIDASHVMHFELPTCQDMTSYIGLSNSHRARTWVQNYHKCLMSELRPLYNSNSISCATLHAFMSDKRQACMINAEMCLIKPEDFSFTLDQATNMETYPNSVPIRMLQEKLTRSHSRLPNYYYRHLGALRGQFGDALCQCRALTDGTCPPLYRVVHDRDGNSYYVMNKYHPRKTGDADCEALGGRCESVPSGCRDPNTPKICDGPANRVCVRGKSKSGSPPCSNKDKTCKDQGGKCESVHPGCLDPEVQTCAGENRACVFPTTGSCGMTGLGIPDPENKLNLYVLPTGQGDAHILQCPNGKLSVMDLGGHIGGNTKFWKESRIKDFLKGKEDQVRNIVISHNDTDHYNRLINTFDEPLTGAENLYISCTWDALPFDIKEWVNRIKPGITIREFNNGELCGPNGNDCGDMDLCPDHSDITTQVLAANMGGCTGDHTNVDSLLFKVIWGDISVLMPGDFEDKSTGKRGAMEQVVEHYRNNQVRNLNSTVYKVSHHGADSRANKLLFREAIGPKAVIASAKLKYGVYNHPRCAALEEYETLCPPGLHKENTQFESLQPKYKCYDTPQKKYRNVSDNRRSIYTTNPDEDTVQLIKFSTDGRHWGITTCEVDHP